MSQDSSFHHLMDRLRARDDEAARQIFQRYAHRLIALAQTRLDPLTLRVVSPEDIMNSVLRSFFLRQANGQFDLASWDNLWGMLVVITLRKCIRQAKHYRAARRDIRRETPLAPAGDEENPVWEALSDDPTPEAALLLTETIQELMSQLGERERQMLTLRLQGYSASEISPQVGRTERTVHRLLGRVKERLERMRSEELLET